MLKRLYALDLCYAVHHTVGCCEHGNDPSGSIKGREILDLAE
jgi:hypothetical protein